MYFDKINNNYIHKRKIITKIMRIFKKFRDCIFNIFIFSFANKYR